MRWCPNCGHTINNDQRRSDLFCQALQVKGDDDVDEEWAAALVAVIDLNLRHAYLLGKHDADLSEDPMPTGVEVLSEVLTLLQTIENNTIP